MYIIQYALEPILWFEANVLSFNHGLIFDLALNSES